MSTVADEEFKKIPTDFLGVLEWRVEDFKLVKQDTIGQFHTGDSYLILHAYQQGTSKRIIRDIYFWLGSTSTTDETGTVAIKAVELDDFYGGAPKQYREIQYHESERFLRLFDSQGGIKYLDGGVESGFRKVVTDKYVDVYMIKGSKTPFVMQVAPQRSSLCQGNCYIIHTPGEFYLFIGNHAGLLEKNKAASALDVMKSRDPKAKVERLEGETCPGLDALLGSEGEIAENDGDDSKFEKEFKRVLYDSEFNVIAEGNKIRRDSLPKGNISFLLYGEKIFAHVGKGSPSDAKRNAITNAVKLMEKAGLPNYTNVEVIVEGFEDDDFDCVF